MDSVLYRVLNTVSVYSLIMAFFIVLGTIGDYEIGYNTGNMILKLGIGGVLAVVGLIANFIKKEVK